MHTVPYRLHSECAWRGASGAISFCTRNAKVAAHRAFSSPRRSQPILLYAAADWSLEARQCRWGISVTRQTLQGGQTSTPSPPSLVGSTGAGALDWTAFLSPYARAHALHARAHAFLWQATQGVRGMCPRVAQSFHNYCSTLMSHTFQALHRQQEQAFRRHHRPLVASHHHLPLSLLAPSQQRRHQRPLLLRV